MKTRIRITVILALFSLSFLSASAQYNKKNTRDFINRTSYIIGEAYDMVYFYGYYSQGNLSNAVNHQNYAKFLYSIGNYRNAIYHSDQARRYALGIIYSSNNYWNNYYRPYYYSYRPPQTNRPPQGHNNNRPPQVNTQYGHRGSSTNVTSTTRNNNSNNIARTSKYVSSGKDVETKDFETWEQNYYSKEELSILENSNRPSEKELEATVMNSNNIRRIANDEEVIKSGIKDFSDDINTFRQTHQQEAKTMAISRPSDFGTTPEVTRSTANRTPSSVSTARPAQTTVPTRSQTAAPARSNTATQNNAVVPANTNKATETRSARTANQNNSINTTQTRSSSTNQSTQRGTTATQKSNTNTRSR